MVEIFVIIRSKCFISIFFQYLSLTDSSQGVKFCEHTNDI